AVQDPVRLADVTHLPLIEAPALESLGVDDVRYRGIAGDHDKGRHIALHDGPAGEKRMRTDLHKLVHGREPTEYDPVSDFDVPGQCRAVGEHDFVANDAIVRHMRIGHEQVVVADAGHAGAVNGSAVDRAALAENIAVAYFQASRLAVVF